MIFTITTNDGPVRYGRGMRLPHISDRANIAYVWEGHISEDSPRLVCKTLQFRANDQEWDREIAAIDAINEARQRPSPPPGLDRIATYLTYGQDADDPGYGHIIMEDHGTPAKVVAEKLDDEDIEEETRLDRRTRLVRALLRDGLEAAGALAALGVYSRDLHPYNFLVPHDFPWDQAADPRLTICDFSHSYFARDPIAGTENTTRGMHCVRPPGLLTEPGDGGRAHAGVLDEAFSVAAAAYLTATGIAPYQQSTGASVTPGTSRAQSRSWALTIDRNLLHKRLSDDQLANDIADLLDIGQEEQRAAKPRRADLDRVVKRLSQPRVDGLQGRRPHDPPALPPTVSPTLSDTATPVQATSRHTLPDYIATTEADFAPIVLPPPPPPLTARIMDPAGPWQPRLRRAIDWAVPGFIAIAVTLLLWAKGYNSLTQSELQVVPGSDPAGTAILAFGLGTSIIASVAATWWFRRLGPRTVAAAFAPLLGIVTFGVALGVAILHRMLYRELSMLPWTAADWGTSQLVILVIAIVAVLLALFSWPLTSRAKKRLRWITAAATVAMLTVAGLPVALAGLWDRADRPEPPCDNPITLSDPMRSICFDKVEGWSSRSLSERPFSTWGPTATLAATDLPCLTAQVIALQDRSGRPAAADSKPLKLTGVGPNPVTASLAPMNNSGTRVRRIAGRNIYVVRQGQPEGTQDLLTAYELISHPANPATDSRGIVAGVGSARAQVVFLERGCSAHQRPAISDLQDSLLAGVHATSLDHVDDFYVAMNSDAARKANISTVAVPLPEGAWPNFPQTEKSLVEDKVIAQVSLNTSEDTKLYVQIIAGQAEAGDSTDLPSGWTKTNESLDPETDLKIMHQFAKNYSKDIVIYVWAYYRDETAIEPARETLIAVLEGTSVND